MPRSAALLRLLGITSHTAIHHVRTAYPERFTIDHSLPCSAAVQGSEYVVQLIRHHSNKNDAL
ncbi:hypothetical protein [Streptomyces sp. f150]|uniref:hypothetical protein n=1 Tax=Streptomyces sp. f150 TaxID=1827699 RepID=UPI0015CF0601|nr:hypothetical protein [Streptomyces sp. f150]